MNTTLLLELLSLIALKGAVVLFAALLLGLGLRRMAASRRYALWITSIATLAVLPLAMWALPAWRVLPKTDAALEWPVMEPPLGTDNASITPLPEDDGSAVHLSKPALPVPSQAPDRPVFSWAISWQDVVESLPMVWMLIAGLLLLRLGHSAWRLHRLEASLCPGECALVPQTARELGLQRMPHLLIGPSDAVPMVWGVLRPRLLLPQRFETWSLEKQRGVLLHELAHLKRGDPLALWTAQWVKALHWFNPLVWLTLHQLRADQERACDDAVLRNGVRASDYAQSLLDLSRHNRLASGLSLCALTITRCAPVEARVKAILDPQRRREGLTLRWLAVLAGGALLITLPVAMLHAIESPMLRGRILDRHGVVLAESTKEKVRNYPLKTLAAHVVGYSGATKAYAGMEKQHDTELTAGKDLTLTLDMRMQSLALRAMTEAGVTRGAAVVLDPRTGEVLAAVSLPSYDPNQFVPTIDLQSWDALLRDRDVPMLDRCFRGFSPGSTYKLLTGLAGTAAGIGGQKFNCTGTVTYGNSVMQCWIHTKDGGSHGMLGMSDSLAVSCNCYWYQFGNAAGIDQIESMGQKIGFGSAYGIMDQEDKGILPSPAWLKEFRPTEKWTNGHTANTSIGQGFVLATPLQMAVLAATVGNGGRVPQPGIVKQQEPAAWRADLTQGTLTAADVEPLREGMRLAVNGDSGTGRPARSEKVVIAGKTGTAQNWRKDAEGTRVEDNHGWLIGFAPFDKPTLAFAIIKNGAKTGGGDCGPIAKRIVEEALALPADGSGEVKAVEEPITPEKQVLLKFDAKAAVIKAAIEGINPDANTGFKLDEITVRNGQVLVRGVASGMSQALQFRDAMLSLKWEDELEWVFPVPQTLKDGKSVGFQMRGVLASQVKNATALEMVRASLVALKDPQSHVWEAVRKTAGLAAIPSGRTALRGEPGDPAIHFYLLQKEVAGWLRDSLGAQVDVGWLETGNAKSKRYPAKSGYEIEVMSGPSPTVFKVIVQPLAKTSSAAPAKVDSDVAEISRQIKLLVKETGISMRALNIDHGKMYIRGESVELDKSLRFRDKLIESGKPWEIEWQVTTPRKLKNHAVWMFVALGTYKPALPQIEVPDLASSPKNWEALQRFGKLADLPADAAIARLKPSEYRSPSPSISRRAFAFTASRHAVHQWLSASLRSKKLASDADKLRELIGTQSFQYVFFGQDACHMQVDCAGDRARVLISRNIIILITPDESQEPRPAGRLAPDYHGKGLTDVNAARAPHPSSLSAEKKRLPKFRPSTDQLRLQPPSPSFAPNIEIMPFPHQHFYKGLSAESEEALLRNSHSGSRMQQILWAESPQRG